MKACFSMLVDGKEISVVLDKDDCVGCVVLKFTVSTLSTFLTFSTKLGIRYIGRK